MPHRTATIALLLLLAGLTAVQAEAQPQTKERATFTVGTATAARGQKATGTIEVPAGSDAALSIPVAVFHGAKPGPSRSFQARTVLNTLRSLPSKS